MATQLTTKDKIKNACTVIDSPDFREKIRTALPAGVSSDRFVRTVLTAVQQDPDIVAKGDAPSLYNAAIRAAQDGLVPDKREAAFVVMGGKVAYMPMVGGIIKRLAEASITIDAQVVYENDEFEQTFGDSATISHKPPKLGQDRGKALGVYAIARTSDGMVFREVMDRNQVEQVRKVSRSANAGPWKDWWDEMARKTVIRRLSKRLPIKDPDIAKTISRDDELYDLDTPAKQGPRTSAAARVNAATAQAEAPADPDVVDAEFTESEPEHAEPEQAEEGAKQPVDERPLSDDF